MKLLNRIQKLKLDPEKRYLLACSGGPDSMALFEILKNQGFSFDVAFVNYKSREESDLEQILVQEKCDNCHSICYVLEKKCSSAENFEREARKIRYEFFRQIMLKTNKYEALLVAHNADDVIETYMLQTARKILPETYGLKFRAYYKEIPVIRPILMYEKRFLTAYCEKKNVKFSIDKSNEDTKYARNKIRKEIISNLNKEEKEVVLKEIDSKNKLLNRCVSKFEKYIEGSIAKPFTKNIEVLQRFLFYFVKKQGNYLLSAKYKNVIQDILNNNKNQHYQFNKFSLIYDDEGLTFITKSLNKITYEYTKDEFNLFGKCLFEEDVKIVPLNKFQSFKLNGHTKKVNRFFIDTKMPLSIRLIWPCVINSNNDIIYVPRYRKNYKISPTSKLIFSVKTLQNLNIWEKNSQNSDIDCILD